MPAAAGNAAAATDATPAAAPEPATGGAPLHKRAMEAWLKLDQMKKAKVSFFAAATCAGLFFVVLIVHLATVTTSMTTPRQQVIVFSDGRHDDYLALNYLLHRSDVAVSHVVASAGSVGTATATARNLRGFLSLVASSPSAPRVPPVYVGAPYAQADATSHNCTFSRAIADSDRYSVDTAYGADTELRRQVRASARDLFTRAHALIAAGQPTDGASAAAGSAGRVTPQPAYFLPDVRRHLRQLPDRSVTIIALGPLTDVATLLDDQAGALRSKIARVVISGGAVRHEGDLGPFFATNVRGETNFFLDPDAAHRVLARGDGDPDVTVVPIDAAADAGYAAQWDWLTQARPGNPVDSWVAAMLQGYYSSVRPQSRFEALGLPRDLVAAAIACSPRVRQASQAHVASVGVAAHPQALSMAGVFGALTGDASARPVSVVASISRDAFWEEYRRMVAAPWPR